MSRIAINTGDNEQPEPDHPEEFYLKVSENLGTGLIIPDLI